MRAPSADLLRALRSATLPPASSSSSFSSRILSKRECFAGSIRIPCCPARIRGPRSLRPFSTSTAAAFSSPFPSSGDPAASPPTPKPKPKIRLNPRAPTTHDRGPPSEETTQTDFDALDILAASGVEAPATSVDACTRDGFHLNNGVQTRGGKGVLLLGGEAFVWTPWNNSAASTGAAEGGEGGFARFLDARRSTLDLPSATLGLLALVYPKPDLLILGTGRRLWQLSRDTRRHLSEELGVKVDVMDTANAAAAYNLLVMERGVDEVAALLVPEGFDPMGKK